MKSSFFFFFKFYVSISIFLTALGLHCCTWAFSSCRDWGYSLVMAYRLLIALVSLQSIVSRARRLVVAVGRLSS